MRLAIMLSVVVGLAGVTTTSTVAGQGGDKAAQIRNELGEVFPEAESWTFVDGDAPHFRGYRGGSGDDASQLVGLAFVTTDIARTNGYKGPIPILVGLTLNGVITRILLFYHREPFGYFSIDLPEFAEQFEGKSILDPLKVGEDIDAITQATVTLQAASRGIRQGARQLVKQFLAERRQ